MGGGAPKNQTVTNRTEIDPVTQAWRQQLINQGGALYNQGPAQYYPGNTVVPFSAPTQQGLGYLQNYAQQGVPNMGMSNFATTRALSGFNPAMGNAAQMAGEDVAQNPYLRGLFDQGAGMVQDRINTQFAQAGRYGPTNAAHTGALTRGLGDLYSQIYAPAYESAQNRRLQATGLMGDIWSQGNQDAARAQAMMPSMYSLGMMPGQSMMDIGSIYEGQAQSYLDADRQRWDYNQNAPWANLERYAGIVNGLPDFSGTSTTSPAQRTNRLMSGLGGAAAGAGLASSMGWLGAAGMTNPLGWLALGGGTLAGLFG